MQVDYFTVDRDNDNNDVVIRNDGFIVARMEHDSSYNNETDRSLEIGANLLASAPELLSQLKIMVEWLGSEWKDTDEVKNSIALIRSVDLDWEPSFETEEAEETEAF
jgi:hypothetical protein